MADAARSGRRIAGIDAVGRDCNRQSKASAIFLQQIIAIDATNSVLPDLSGLALGTTTLRRLNRWRPDGKPVQSAIVKAFNTSSGKA